MRKFEPGYKTSESRIRLQGLLEATVIALGLLLVIVGFVNIPEGAMIYPCNSMGCSPPRNNIEAWISLIAGATATALGTFLLVRNLLFRTQRKPD